MNALSIGVLMNGKNYIEHFGELVPGSGIKPTNETIYEIASVSKTFTGTLAAKAVLEGRLTLEDDIRLYLNGDYANLAYRNNPIQIQHLLTHTSGLPSNNKGFESLPSGLDFTEMAKLVNEIEKRQTKGMFFQYLSEVSIDTLPGIRFNYSNYGANLMAAILENVYDVPFQELVEKEIIDKADMISTSFHLSERDKKRLAPGYNERDEKMHHLSLASTLWGAEGAIKSTLPDMLKYARFQLDMQNKMAVESHKKIKELDTNYWVGYFWWIIGEDGKNLHFRHDGGAAGTRGVLLLYPESEIGIYAVTNVVGEKIFDDLSRLSKGVFRSLNKKN